eukprot:Tbor_TRINITY_DN5657_c4_g1::TRINITY_DN5657_c4_g1_i1::g.9449::m.9449
MNTLSYSYIYSILLFAISYTISLHVPTLVKSSNDFDKFDDDFDNDFNKMNKENEILPKDAKDIIIKSLIPAFVILLLCIIGICIFICMSVYRIHMQGKRGTAGPRDINNNNINNVINNLLKPQGYNNNNPNLNNNNNNNN